MLERERPCSRRTRISRLALMLAVFGGGYLAISYLLLPWLYAIG